MRRLLALGLLAPALALSACGSSSSQSTSSASSSGSAQGSSSAAGPAAGCTKADAPQPKPDGHEPKPTAALTAGKQWSLTVETNCGNFTVALDTATAPHAAASMVSLARAGFFDGTIFHRIVPGFVIQGGDPTGSGTGGPGYSTVDPPPSTARYTRGVVAMAKTQSEAPGTAGSQFYVVTGADAQLPPDYAVLGRVSSGLDTVERIGALGDPSSGDAGTPTQTVLVSHVTVGER